MYSSRSGKNNAKLAVADLDSVANHIRKITVEHDAAENRAVESEKLSASLQQTLLSVQQEYETAQTTMIEQENTIALQKEVIDQQNATMGQQSETIYDQQEAINKLNLDLTLIKEQVAEEYREKLAAARHLEQDKFFDAPKSYFEPLKQSEASSEELATSHTIKSSVIENHVQIEEKTRSVFFSKFGAPLKHFGEVFKGKKKPETRQSTNNKQSLTLNVGNL